MSIRVFAGCSPNHEDLESQSVFEWSIRKHASEEVDVFWLKMQHEGLLSGWNSTDWATPFTAYRWVVPEMCFYQGRAIYCDSDFIFVDDIAKLFHQPMPDESVMLAKNTKRLCIVLWDCEKAKKYVPPVSSFRDNPGNNSDLKLYFMQHPHMVAPFEGNWNCLDGEGVSELKPPAVSAIHYTSVPHQPHLRRAIARLAEQGVKHWYHGLPADHPRSDLVSLFDSLLDEAAQNGYGIDRYSTDPQFGPYPLRRAIWNQPIEVAKK